MCVSASAKCGLVQSKSANVCFSHPVMRLSALDVITAPVHGSSQQLPPLWTAPLMHAAAGCSPRRMGTHSMGTARTTGGMLRLRPCRHPRPCTGTPCTRARTRPPRCAAARFEFQTWLLEFWSPGTAERPPLPRALIPKPPAMALRTTGPVDGLAMTGECIDGMQPDMFMLKYILFPCYKHIFTSAGAGPRAAHAVRLPCAGSL